MSELSEFDALGYSYESDCGVEQYGCRVPEQALWCAVLHQALMDAEDGCLRAKEWLLYEHTDFVTVCSLAGVSPIAVRKAAWRKVMPLKRRIV